MGSFKLEILTPYGHYFNGDVDYLSLRNKDGVLGILPRHTPLITTVELCNLTLIINGKRRIYAISKGLLNVKGNNEVSLMVNTIERSDEIDVERAKRALERAKKRLEHHDEKINVKRAEAAIKRAENRINAAKDK